MADPKVVMTCASKREVQERIIELRAESERLGIHRYQRLYWKRVWLSRTVCAYRIYVEPISGENGLSAMGILLVTKNRFDRLMETHRNDRAQREAQARGMQEQIKDLSAKLGESQRLVDGLTRLIQDDSTRRRGVEIANSEIIIWKVNELGMNEPPMVRNTIAGFWEQYKGLRPEDLGDLLPGMIGISVLPRKNTAASDTLRAAQRVYEPKATTNDSERTTDHSNG